MRKHKLKRLMTEVSDRGGGGGGRSLTLNQVEDKISLLLGCCSVSCQSTQLDVAFSQRGSG